MRQKQIYVGLDVHKDTLTIAIAAGGRRGETRHYDTISSDLRVVRHLDHWIRRRLPCCYWFRAKRQDRARSEPDRMWRTRGNRIRQLMRLGVNRKDAILHGLSGSGCWAMSKSPTLNHAMNNDWLSNQGLPSLTEKWAHIHYPTTVR